MGEQYGSGVVGDPRETARGKGELAGVAWGITGPVRRSGTVGAAVFGVLAGAGFLSGFVWGPGWVVGLGLVFLLCCVLALYGRSVRREVSSKPLGRVEIEAAMQEAEMPYYVCTDCCVLMDEMDVMNGRCEHCGLAASCLHITSTEDAQLAIAAMPDP